MGFGISDEVMEKIRDSLWFDPGVFIAGGQKTRNISNSPQFYFPHASQKISPTYSSLTDQELFLVSTYYAISQAISKDRLKSTIISDRITLLSDYYVKLFQVLSLDTSKVLSIAKSRFDKTACSFLMRSIIDGLLRLFDSPSLPKPDFRDTMDDLFYLANSWSITPPDITNRSSYFFSYVKSVYGLQQSEFFCCPYCGEPLVKGIAFCPNCLENSRDTITPRYRPNLQVFSARSKLNEGEKSDTIDGTSNTCQLKKTEEEKWELSKRLGQLNEANANQINTDKEQIDELNATIEKLKQLLAERDKSIASLLHKIYEDRTEPEQSPKKKILVFGASSIPIEELQEIADEVGLTDVDMVFQTEYVKLKQYAVRIKKDSSYVGIVLGPVPHKIKEENGATSPAAYFNGAGFPFVVEAKTYSGQLKITRQSARMAFAAMFQHLLSAGFYM